MILFYCGYYILDFSFGMLWWTTSKLCSSIYFIYSNRRIENNIDQDYVYIENNKELKKEIKELKDLLIKSTTGKINT